MWFDVSHIQKRLVDLTSTYYLVDTDNGDLEKFYADYGTVEMNYNPEYNSSSESLIEWANNNWYDYPYVYTFHWDKRKWPKDGITVTYDQNDAEVSVAN